MQERRIPESINREDILSMFKDMEIGGSNTLVLSGRRISEPGLVASLPGKEYSLV